jgi:hypothetical protein
LFCYGQAGQQTNLLSIRKSWILKYRYSVFERRFKKKSKRKFLHQFSTIKRKKAIQDSGFAFNKFISNTTSYKKYRKLKEKDRSDFDELGFEPTSLF